MIVPSSSFETCIADFASEDIDMTQSIILRYNWDLDWPLYSFITDNDSSPNSFSLYSLDSSLALADQDISPILVYSSNSCLVTIWALIVLQTNPNNIIKIIFFMLTWSLLLVWCIFVFKCTKNKLINQILLYIFSNKPCCKRCVVIIDRTIKKTANEFLQMLFYSIFTNNSFV